MQGACYGRRMAIVEVSATDCDGYAFLAPRTMTMRGERCPGCGGVLDKAATPIDRLAFRKRYDLAFTFDGELVVSERMHELYKAHCWQGFAFTPLVGRDGFMLARAIGARLRYVPDRLRRGRPCKRCGRFGDVQTDGPIAVYGPIDLAGRFARTDEELGSLCEWSGGRVHDERAPVVLCGDDVAAVVSAAKLSGWLAFKPVEIVPAPPP